MFMFRIIFRCYAHLFTLLCCLGELNASLNCTCGKPSATHSRVVNGVETGKNEFPWIVAIRNKVPSGSSIPNLPFCAGTLISDRFVVTAAHCLVKLSNENDWNNVELVFGMHWARSDPPEVEVRDIKRAVMKLQFRDMNKDFDVAMLEMVDPIEVNDFIYPICLPYNLQFPQIDPWVVAAGWGRKSYAGRQAEKLMKTKWMEMVQWDACVKKTKYKDRNLLTDRMLCGVSDITDACLGDSGGPLMYYHTKFYRWFLVGITSFGWGCNEVNDPGVYTNLFHKNILGWITCSNQGDMCMN